MANKVLIKRRLGMDKDLATIKPELATAETEREQLADFFLTSLGTESQSAYRADLRDFAEFLGKRCAQSASDWLLRHPHGDANYVVLSYRNNLRERGLATATINRRIAAIRSMVAFANTIGLISWKLDIGNIEHQAYKNVTGLAPESFKLLLDTTRQQKYTDKAARDTAILLLMHDLGLRRKEVVGLDYPTDVNFQMTKIWILGKGRTQKESLSLPGVTLTALTDWINIRGDWEGPVFVSFRKSKMTRMPLSKRGLTYLITTLGRAIGVKLHPHMLRHTAINTAVELATQNNIPIDEVLQYSRHRNIQTLLIYRNTLKNMQGEIANLVSESIDDGNG